MDEEVKLTLQSSVEVRPRLPSLSLLKPDKDPDKSAALRTRGFDYGIRISSHSPRVMTPLGYFRHLEWIYDVIGLPLATHMFNDHQLTNEPLAIDIQRLDKESDS